MNTANEIADRSAGRCVRKSPVQAGPGGKRLPPKLYLPAFKAAWRVCSLMLVGLWATASFGENPPKSGVTEYQLKAIYLFNFTRFVEWPTGAFAQTNAPFVVGIVGEDSFGKDLEDMIRGERVHDRVLVLKHLQADDDLTGCNAIFISRSEIGKLDSVLSQVKGRPILTIGDTPGFAEQGVMANLLLVEGSIKMEINQKAVEDASLTASSKLLTLARLVRTNRSKP